MKNLSEQILEFADEKRKNYILNSKEYKDLYKEENAVISGFYDLFLRHCMVRKEIGRWIKHGEHMTDDAGHEYVKVNAETLDYYFNDVMPRHITNAMTKLAKIHTEEYPLTEEHLQKDYEAFGQL